MSGFYKKSAAKDGLQSQCKACANAYHADWVSANKERAAAYNAAWRDANKGYDAAYYAKNKEHRTASTAAWQRANPDKVKASTQRRRARKANAQGTHTADDWRQRLAYHGYKCIYCGVEKHQTPEGWLTCDHLVPLARGGTNWPSNLAPACHSCNCSKNNKTYFEFMEYLERKKNQ